MAVPAGHASQASGAVSPALGSDGGWKPSAQSAGQIWKHLGPSSAQQKSPVVQSFPAESASNSWVHVCVSDSASKLVQLSLVQLFLSSHLLAAHWSSHVAEDFRVSAQQNLFSTTQVVPSDEVSNFELSHTSEVPLTVHASCVVGSPSLQLVGDSQGPTTEAQSARHLLSLMQQKKSVGAQEVPSASGSNSCEQAMCPPENALHASRLQGPKSAHSLH